MINKIAIQSTLRTYVDRFGSQNKAANSLKGISAATINHMLQGKWEQIKDEMWRNVAGQIDYTDTQWNVVETRNYKLLKHLLTDAQNYSNVLAIVDDAGTGKSETLKQYTASNPKAYMLKCSEFWNRKFFLQELLSAMGEDCGGFTVAEMMQTAVLKLKAQHKPLIIMDEADKLSDQVFYFFITLYNALEDRCGIVMCATNYLQKRIQRGVNNNKKGYKEIYSRMGRKFINLKGVNVADVTAVCIANGIDDRKLIKEIFIDCEGDLRRVKRKVHAIKIKNARQNQTQKSNINEPVVQ